MTGVTVTTGLEVPRPRRSRAPSSRAAGPPDAGRKLLVPYVTGGLGADWTDIVARRRRAGADAIEIGIPFSDPVMDGPIIQEASRARPCGPGPRRSRSSTSSGASTPACRSRS